MINAASITMTADLLVLIAEVDEFKGAWRALGTLAPERLLALRRVATIESIGSSTRIEGSRLAERSRQPKIEGEGPYKKDQANDYKQHRPSDHYQDSQKGHEESLRQFRRSIH